MDDTNIQILKEKLLKSNWPKCNELANEIAIYNNQEAKSALIDVLNEGERHHIRTAAIKVLASFNESDVVTALEKRLDDAAYEPRMEAKKVLKKLTGKDYLTDKGE